MSAVENRARSVEIVELRRILMVVRSAVAVLLSPGKVMRLPPTVRRERCVSFLFGLMSQTRFPYVTVLPLRTKCRGMKAIVLVPVGIRWPTPFVNLPSSLANDVCHCVAVGPLTRSLYSSVAPVVGSRTEFITRCGRWGKDWSWRMLAAVAYRDDDGGGSSVAVSRLTKAVCCCVNRVGYRCCIGMCIPSHPRCLCPVYVLGVTAGDGGTLGGGAGMDDAGGTLGGGAGMGVAGGTLGSGGRMEEKSRGRRGGGLGGRMDEKSNVAVGVIGG